MAKRRWGDRRDGAKIRDLDAMHQIMPLMYPNRCDNEAYMTMSVELSKTEDYIREYNKQHPDARLSIFDLVIAAMLKTIRLRPFMNRFIANETIYQRNEITAAFVVKKNLQDDGEEALARIVGEDTDTLESISKKVREQIAICKVQDDQSMEAVKFISYLPGKHLIGAIARFLDRHGWMPKAVIETDPFQCSVVVSNLGSVGMNIGYHHLTNWGTNSIFIVMGSKQNRPHYDSKGNLTMSREIDLSFTIDERIADGFYYGRTMKLFKRLVENPELLETILKEEVAY